MVAIIISLLLAFILQLAIWQGVFLGGTWLLNTLFDLSISYYLVGGVVFGVWLIVLTIQFLFLYGAYKQ